jgi:aspartyl-tRNA(Asn)/glutamyl-tRNA(Gln) amidotransferase subunit A
MTAIHELSIEELADAMERGEISSVEATRASLARIHAVDPRVNAFAALHEESALRTASAMDELRAAGHVLGPLHGVPLAVKDNVAEAGRANPAGSAILRESFADRDATVTQRLRQNGAVLIGRLNMHEFAQGVTTYNPHTGPTKNPWNLGRSPGGSSGGSGAAVAAREVFGALGTDTGCSVRLPAAFNGVTGIRPTIGRVSNHGVVPLAWSMDTVGPLARSAADCFRILSAIAGADPADPTTSVAAVGEMRHRPLRLGVLEPSEDRPVHGDVQAALDEAVRVFTEAGHVASTISLPDLEHSITALKVVNMAEPAGTHGTWVRGAAEAYGDDLRVLMDGAEFFLARHYIQAQRYRSHVARLLAGALEDVDIVITPTVEFPAPPLGADEIALPSGVQVDVITGVLRYNSLPSLTGLPAMSIPVGFTEGGLPVGMQLIGRPFSEALLAGFGADYQSRTDWHRRVPGL